LQHRDPLPARGTHFILDAAEIGSVRCMDRLLAVDAELVGGS
jgi:hypothetical protein